MNFFIEVCISFFLLVGASFVLIGSIGLARMSDFFMRLHGPTKATTLGMGCILLGSIIFFTSSETVLSLHELLISIFLFITAPISAHMLMKTALHLKIKMDPKTKKLKKEEDKCFQ